MIGKIYKCSNANKEYKAKYIDSIAQHVYEITTGYESINTIERVIHHGYARRMLPVYFKSDQWEYIKREHVEQTIENIGSLVDSKDEFIKTCCVTSNRKLIFPLGYSTSYLLNACVFKDYIIENNSIPTLVHIDSGLWLAPVCLDTYSISERFNIGLIPKIYDDKFKDKINPMYEIDKYLQFDDDKIIKIGPHSIFFKDDRLYIEKMFGVNLSTKYANLAKELVKYQIMTNGHTNNFRFTINWKDISINYLKNLNIYNDYIEALENTRIYNIVNKKIQSIIQTNLSEPDLC